MSTKSSAVPFPGRRQTSDVLSQESRSLATYELADSDLRLLLREYTHRINNDFSAVISAISIAAARSPSAEAKAALNAVEDQLHNYARVHHALQMPEYCTRIDAAAYIRQLCRAISRSKLESKGIELLLMERTFLMDAERCWRLGLILSELITNASRHAFASGVGSIRIDLVPSRSSLECRVVDNGASKVNATPGHGLGIVEALVKSLGGTLCQRFGPHGTTSVVVVPRRSEAARELDQRSELDVRWEERTGH